jgi:hypothetical protein
VTDRVFLLLVTDRVFLPLKMQRELQFLMIYGRLTILQLLIFDTYEQVLPKVDTDRNLPISSY